MAFSRYLCSDEIKIDNFNAFLGEQLNLKVTSLVVCVRFGGKSFKLIEVNPTSVNFDLGQVGK